MNARPARERRLAFAILGAQIALLGAFFAAPRGHAWPLPAPLATVGSAAVLAGWAILVVAAVNLGRALTALPTPTAGGSLKTGGLYRFVRHPIYSGLLLIVFGGTLTSRSGLRLLLAATLFGLLQRKADWEETLLRDRYPDYADYARRTPRFVPSVRRRGGGCD